MKKVLMTASLSLALCAQCFVGVQAAAPQDDLTFDDVQDAGVCLNLIRRAAINIYGEAARTPVTAESNPEIPEVHSIPYSAVGKKLLAPRREWLLYFLTSMEPVIRDLGDEVSKTEKGLNPIIPADLKPSIDPLWKNWTDSITKLNHDLDILLPLVDDAPHNNAKIQAVAVDIFKDVNQLEEQRKTIFGTFKKLQQQYPSEKIKINRT